MDLNAKTQLLKAIPYGIYIVGVAYKNQTNAFTATWISQCSLKPPMVSIAIRKNSLSYKLIQQNPVLSINYLAKNQQHILKSFFSPAKQEDSRLSAFPYSTDQTGTPILDQAIAYLESSQITLVPTRGDHDLIIAEITHAQIKVTPFDPIVLSDTPWAYGG